MIKQHAPFELLESNRQPVPWVRRAFVQALHIIDKRCPVPMRKCQPKKGFIRIGLGDDRLGLGGNGRKDRMIPALGVPVLAVPEIPFSSVHDRVPETASGRMHLLTDPMGFVQIIMPQPQPG